VAAVAAAFALASYSTRARRAACAAASALGAIALERLHDAGYRQCRFQTHDLTVAAPIPGAPFDLVYARLLLFHLPRRVAVLARLWHAVAPGGHLVVQDYDLRGISVLPALDSIDELVRAFTDAFIAADADVHVGARLPQLFARACIGDPDGTDVAGRLESLASGGPMLPRVLRSVLPAALARGITTEAQAAATLAACERDIARSPDPPFLWPLLIGAWKGKEHAAG
jgi:SAM-dependent methyltransferase